MAEKWTMHTWVFSQNGLPSCTLRNVAARLAACFLFTAVCNVFHLTCSSPHRLLSVFGGCGVSFVLVTSYGRIQCLVSLVSHGVVCYRCVFGGRKMQYAVSLQVCSWCCPRVDLVSTLFCCLVYNGNVGEVYTGFLKVSLFKRNGDFKSMGEWKDAHQSLFYFVFYLF